MTIISSKLCYNVFTLRARGNTAMQYGANVESFKRIKNSKEENEDKAVNSPVILLLKILCVFLISRVVITLDITSIDNIAPFGITIVMAMLEKNTKRDGVVICLGAIIGYLSLYKSNSEVMMYIVIVSVLMTTRFITIKGLKSRVEMLIKFAIIFAAMCCYRMIINNFSIGTTVTISMIQTVLMYPIYYIFNFSLNCFDDINTNHYFTNEEIISMMLVFCLVLAGIGGVSVYGVGIRNVLALAGILVIAYSLGGPLGAAAGVIIGVIIGISTNNMMQIIGIYGLCALTAGIFKDTGKLFASIACFIMYLILNIYSKTLNIQVIGEISAAVVIFYIVPKDFLGSITKELDNTVKEDNFNIFHFNKLKEEFSGRLNDFTEVISSMSMIIDELQDNKKLLMQNKGAALIEQLGDRVCDNCDMKNMCWKREFRETYADFSELIQNYEEGNKRFPAGLEKRCIKKFNLIKNTDEIVENHILNEVWKNRLEEGRRMLASQLNSMAVTMGELVDDFNNDIVICSDIERDVFKALNRYNIKYDDVLCYNDKNGRLNIKIILDECGGCQYCVKSILPVINQAIGAEMAIGGDGCVIDPVTKKCTVLIEESPKFYVSSYCASACKDDENYTGDSFTFGKSKDGRYTIAISDGMGSGPEAGNESKAIVDLIEKFTKAGFSDLTAIDAVNSIMSMKFSEDEKFATLDMQDIDLYSGEITFIKIGAVETFVKKAKSIQVINSKTLPFGILDKPDVDIVEKKVSGGDIIVTVSDGILDVGETKNNFQWLSRYLMETDIKDPKQLSREILERAKEMNGGKVKDDMTVVVSKVYSI